MNKLSGWLHSVNKQESSKETFPTSASDPRLSSAVDYANKHGGDPKQALIEIAKQNGVTIDQNVSPMDALLTICKAKGVNPVTAISNLFNGR